MLTPNLQIGKTSAHGSRWWAIDGGAQPPYFGTLGSAGNDLRTLEAVVIPLGRFVTIPTGLGIDIPTGHFG